MGHSRPIFLYFRFFNTFHSKQIYNLNFSNDWIRMGDIWYKRWPLCQLRHNQCPKLLLVLLIRILVTKGFARWSFIAMFRSRDDNLIGLSSIVVEKQFAITGGWRVDEILVAKIENIYFRQMHVVGTYVRLREQNMVKAIA